MAGIHRYRKKAGRFSFSKMQKGGGGRALSSQVVGQGSEEREITRYVNAAHAAECREKSSSHRAKANSEQLQWRLQVSHAWRCNMYALLWLSFAHFGAVGAPWVSLVAPPVRQGWVWRPPESAPLLLKLCVQDFCASFPRQARLVQTAGGRKEEAQSAGYQSVNYFSYRVLHINQNLVERRLNKKLILYSSDMD